MSNYRTGLDLINATLSVSGELVDGTSGYQTDAQDYINLAWKGVLTGGNIFGIDVAEPWTWALAKRPIVLTLVPNIETLGVTTTQYNFNITFSSAPVDVLGNPISVQGWWINMDDRDEYFRITSHVSGAVAAQIDAPYTEASLLNANCNLVKLDYDLIDDTIVVDNYSNLIDFSEGAGSALLANLTNGTYAPATYATMVASALTAASGALLTYTGAWNENTRLFTWSAPSTFSLLNVSGANAAITTASATMGLECLDYTGASTYLAVYPLNAINRLTSPMLCYRKANQPWSGPKNEGKIYEISVNTFGREYPLTMMQAGTPEKYCITNVSTTGIVSVRFNSYMYQLPTKVEVGYIPKQRDLQYNSISLPSMPEEHRSYLVDAAAARLMSDKTDSKRTEREAMAKAGLQALTHSHRKDLSLAGINYGKLVARPGQTRRNWRFWQIT